MKFEIRGKEYEIAIATDYHLVMITNAMDGSPRRPKQDSDIAYVVKSCCPELERDGFVHYRCITVGDVDETEFSQALNADEVAVFVAALSTKIVIDRAERIAALELTDPRHEKTREELLGKCASIISEHDKTASNMKINVLLGGVDIDVTPSKIIPKPATRPIKSAAVLTNAEKIAALQKELQQLESTTVGV